jgi:ribosomal protein S18 acetylase RimI-like enzyme
MGSDDFPIVDLLLRAAFRREESFAPRLARHLALEPEGWCVAVEEGRVLGSAGLTVMGGVAYVGLVAVAPSARRRGIARTMMLRLLAYAKARGCATVLLDASEDGRPLYEGLGFVTEDKVGAWRREPRGLGPMLAPPPAAEPRVAPLAPGREALEELYGFDKAAWGADRSRVLASFIADDPALVATARGADGLIQGYALIQEAPRVLGPLLALSPVAAGALLVWALGREAPLVEIAYLPEANVEGGALLSRSGFSLTRTNSFMRLGTALPAARRRIVYSQASFALG